MRLHVLHSVRYSFSEPQARLVQLLRLTPSSYEGQSVLGWRIDACRDARLKRSRDGYGNIITMLYVDSPLIELTLTVTGEVLTDDRAGQVIGAPDTLPPLFYSQPTALTVASPELATFAQEQAGKGPALDRMHRLADALHDRLELRPDPTAAAEGSAAAFASGGGIAADLAHCTVAAARTIGLPARYVSGHRYDPTTAGAAQHSGHGWAEVHVDGYGWIGFDTARGQCPTDSYIRVATGLDGREAAPLSGQRTGGGAEHLAVDVLVERDAALLRR